MTANPADDFQKTPTRLYSLDALRGFDMFWIMGAEEIFHALADATKWGPFDGYRQPADPPCLERFSFV